MITRWTNILTRRLLVNPSASAKRSICQCRIVFSGKPPNRTERILTTALLSLDSNFFQGDIQDVYEKVIPADIRNRLSTESNHSVLRDLLIDIQRSQERTEERAQKRVQRILEGVPKTRTLDGREEPRQIEREPEQEPKPYQGSKKAKITEQTLLAIYEPIRGELDDNTAILLSGELYRRGNYEAAMQVLLECLPMMGVISAVLNNIVPGFEEFEGRSFVLGNVCLAMVRNGQDVLAYQILQECYSGGSGDQAILAERNFNEVQKVANDELTMVLEGGKPEYAECDLTRWAYAIVAAEEVWKKPYLAYKLFGRWFIRQDVKPILTDRKETAQMETSRKGPPGTDATHIQQVLIKTPPTNFALRNVLKRLYYFTQRTSKAKAEKMRCKLAKAFACGLYDVKRLRVFADLDLSLLPSFTYNLGSHHVLWRAFEKYVERRPGSEYPKTLASFLESAINHGQAYDIGNAISIGRGQFNARLLGRAYESMAWAVHRDPLTQDQELYNKDLNTQMLERAINYSSTETAKLAVDHCVQRMYDQQQSSSSSASCVPGKVLWRLLLAIERSELSSLNVRTEKILAQLVVRRPRLEQMRYMSLSKVSPRGVLKLAEAYVDWVAGQDRGTDGRDLDVKLVTAAMVIMREKRIKLGDNRVSVSSDGGSNGSSFTSSRVTNTSYVSLVAQIFQRWQYEEALELCKQLQTQRLIRPSVREVRQIIDMLLRRNKYALALSVAQSMPMSHARTRAYCMILIYSAYWVPQITMRVFYWLSRVKQVDVPVDIVRAMIKRFASSPKLSDAQSSRRIRQCIRELRRMDTDIGKRTADAIVERLMFRSVKRGHGSRQRLQWALDLAQSQHVKERQVRRWFFRLYKMRQTQSGYWSRRRDT